MISCLIVAIFLSAPSRAAGETITVFAASSLRDALVDVAERHEATAGDDVTLVFAASSAIARQVARGAPADVVLLADRSWANWLVEEGVIAQPVAFAGNRLVLIGQNADPLNSIDGLALALGDGVLATAQVDAVPAGRYAKAALVSLGLWDRIEPQIVQAANVRAALRFVERGEAALGIGYASDLVALPSLNEVYAFAPDTHPEIVYSGAQLTPKGADFMTYLQSAPAQDVLALWGFLPLDETR